MVKRVYFLLQPICNVSPKEERAGTPQFRNMEAGTYAGHRRALIAGLLPNIYSICFLIHFQTHLPRGETAHNRLGSYINH